MAILEANEGERLANRNVFAHTDGRGNMRSTTLYGGIASFG